MAIYGKKIEEMFFDGKPLLPGYEIARATDEQDIQQGTDFILANEIRIDLTTNFAGKDHVIADRVVYVDSSWSEDFGKISIGLRIGNRFNHGTLFNIPVIVIGLFEQHVPSITYSVIKEICEPNKFKEIMDTCCEIFYAFQDDWNEGKIKILKDTNGYIYKKVDNKLVCLGKVIRKEEKKI